MVGETIIVLLAGGDKATQDKDINYAQELWGEYKDDIDKHIRDFA